MERRVLAISNKDLFGLFRRGRFQGYEPIDLSKLRKIIYKSKLMDKKATEKDPEFKQVVAYTLIFDQQGRLFLYRRADGLTYEEAERLGGVYSVGVGGHFEVTDVFGRTGLDIVWQAILRELREEVKIDGDIKKIDECIKKRELSGFVNYDSDPVSRNHIAIVATIEVEGTVSLANDENTYSGMKTIREIIELFDGQSSKKLEAWSWICLARRLRFPENFERLPPRCAYKVEI